MKLRVVTPIANPAWVLQAGRILTVDTLTPEIRGWLNAGHVVPVPEDGPEAAVREQELERAVLPQRRRRRSETVAS